MDGFSGLHGRTKANARRAVTSGIVLAVACLVVGVGSAWAGSGVSLCMPKKEGSAVLTPKHGVCPKAYRLTALSLEGKEGKAGADGKEGKAGVPGEAGKPGTTGVEGKQGPEGKEGPLGKEGPEGKIAGLSKAELETLQKILPHILYVAAGIGGKPTVQFSGVNVQVVSGAGKTTTINGLGNLVIGYDENTGHLQTGSSNLVLGEQQTFTSYAGILAGFENTISGPFASVTGGGLNKATFKEASISGGWSNTASAENASVSGGRENTANNEYSSISGGKKNTASGLIASVGGGLENTASGKYASIFGGKGLTASIEFEAIP
jgi:hypothetical protein